MPLSKKARVEVYLLYADTFFTVKNNFALLSEYTDRLRVAASKALEEETILIVVIVVIKVYHSE